MLEPFLKNANISAHYFGVGLLLALRSCSVRLCLTGGMCLCMTAALFCALQLQIPVLSLLSGLVGPCWVAGMDRRCFGLFPFIAEASAELKMLHKYVPLQMKKVTKRPCVEFGCVGILNVLGKITLVLSQYIPGHLKFIRENLEMRHDRLLVVT